MALMNNRAEPAADSARSLATASVAGWLPPIHSRIAQESRTRVFTLALLASERRECAHQIAAASALEFFPRSVLRENDFLAANLQREPRALGEVERFTNFFGYGDLPLGG